MLERCNIIYGQINAFNSKCGIEKGGKIPYLLNGENADAIWKYRAYHKHFKCRRKGPPPSEVCNNINLSFKIYYNAKYLIL